MSSVAPRALLEAKSVIAGYGERNVLEGLDLTINRGEIYALLGANGAGKSTAINVFLGLQRPRGGSARVCGFDVAADPAQARQNLAYLPESVALYEHLSAVEYLQYMLALAGGETSLPQIHAALDAAGFPTASRDARTSGYSKGMRQKVAIALAIARKAPVLLLDEPASGLDPVAAGELNQVLHSLRNAGTAILLVTHDVPSAAEFADRIGILRGGRIAREIGASGEQRFDLAMIVQQYRLDA